MSCTQEDDEVEHKATFLVLETTDSWMDSNSQGKNTLHFQIDQRMGRKPGMDEMELIIYEGSCKETSAVDLLASSFVAAAVVGPQRNFAYEPSFAFHVVAGLRYSKMTANSMQKTHPIASVVVACLVKSLSLVPRVS